MVATRASRQLDYLVVGGYDGSCAFAYGSDALGDAIYAVQAPSLEADAPPASPKYS